MNEAIEIQLSKSKLILMLLGSLIFVALGSWFMINPEKFLSLIFRSTTMIFVGGLLGVLFFGFVGFFIFKKIFDKSPGLVISDDGILDNSSGVSAGFIPWSDIIEIKETKVANQKFINLVVKNPQTYFDNQRSIWKRWIMKRNFASFGTAIGISSNGLKYKYEDLTTLLHKKFDEVNSKASVNQH